jgi:hypothetical protein
MFGSPAVSQHVSVTTCVYLRAGVSSLGVHHDGVAVISGGIDGTVYVSNIQTGRVLGALSGARWGHGGVQTWRVWWGQFMGMWNHGVY